MQPAAHIAKELEWDYVDDCCHKDNRLAPRAARAGLEKALRPLPELRKMADEFNLKLISIRDMIAYRLRQESIVEKGVEVDMPTEHGHFRLIPFRQKSNGLEHVALFKGIWEPDEPVLVRVHSSCATGDIFGSMRCDCGEQLHKAMELIEKAGKGAIVYLNQEGRGIGLMEKMRAYKLQEDGMDTVDANICLGHLAGQFFHGSENMSVKLSACARIDQISFQMSAVFH